MPAAAGRKGYVGSRLLGALGHRSHRPAPVGQIAGRGAVGRAGGLLPLGHRLPARRQARDPLGGMTSDRGRHLLPGCEGLAVRRARRVVPGRLDHEAPQVLVAGLCVAAGGPAAAGVLRGRQPHPCGEGGRAPEARELAGLGRHGEGGGGVYALEAPEGVAPRLPPRLLRPCAHHLLQGRPLLACALAAPHVVLKRLLRGGVGYGQRFYPVRVPPRPVAHAAAGRIGLLEPEPVPQQELREQLLRALGLLAGVGEGLGQIAGALAAGVGHPHGHDVADREHPGQELGVVAVVLPAAVGRRFDHFGDRAHDAVDAEPLEPALEVEAGHSRLVAAPGGLRQPPRPVRHGRQDIAEGRCPHLAGGDLYRHGLDRAGVDIEPYGGAKINHWRPPMSAASPRLQDTTIIGPDPRDDMRKGLPMLCSYRLLCCRLECGSVCNLMDAPYSLSHPEMNPLSRSEGLRVINYWVIGELAKEVFVTQSILLQCLNMYTDRLERKSQIGLSSSV